HASTPTPPTATPTATASTEPRRERRGGIASYETSSARPGGSGSVPELPSPAVRAPGAAADPAFEAEGSPVARGSDTSSGARALSTSLGAAAADRRWSRVEAARSSPDGPGGGS